MSNEIVGGVVEKIFEKKTQRGTFYNICLLEDDGSKNWYGWGKYPPKFGEGSEIEFEVTYNGDFANANTKSVDVIELVEAAPQRSRGQRGGGRGQQQQQQSGGRRTRGSAGGDSAGTNQPAPVKQGGTDWDRKDKIIQWQSCRNSAIAVLELALKADALPLPAKKAEKLDALVGAVDELTAQFFKDNNESPFQDSKPKRAAKQPPADDAGDEPPFDDDEDDGLPGDE